METKTTPYQTAMKYGLYYALATIIVDISFFIFNIGISMNWLNGTLKFIIAVLFIYLGIKARRDEDLNGYISYSQALGFGAIMSLFSALILSVFAFINMKYIDPEGMDRVIKELKEQMIINNKSEEEIEMSIGMIQKMKSPAMAVPMAFIGSFLWGFILSLIIAIFARKNDLNQS